MPDGRALTAEELETARVCGLVTGYDVDDEREAPVQLRHLVVGEEHGHMRPICGATTLWGYDFTPTATDVITCEACLARLSAFVLRKRRRMRLPA